MPNGLTQALQSIQPELTTASTAANLGSTAYNMYNQYQNQQYQDQLRSDAQNPQKVNALAAQYTQPLTAGLQTGVANNTQAYLAQRGLSDSPQISEQVQAQAIAPYIQQNQQNGYQNAIQALGLGGGAIPPAMQQQNSLAALTKGFSQMALPSAAGNPQALLNYLRTMGTQPQQLDPSQFNPGVAPGPVDTSGWNSTVPDMSSIFSPAAPNVTYDPGNFTPDYFPAQ